MPRFVKNLTIKCVYLYCGMQSNTGTSRREVIINYRVSNNRLGRNVMNKIAWVIIDKIRHSNAKEKSLNV